MKIRVESLIAPPSTAEYDPYAANVPAEDFLSVNPATFQVALSAAGPPPKMFSGGTADLPAFTASGLDVRQLMKLPALTRHWAAAEPDLAKVHGFFEQYSDDGYSRVEHEGLNVALERVRDWAMGRDDRVERYSEAAYTKLFGETR